MFSDAASTQVVLLEDFPTSKTDGMLSKAVFSFLRLKSTLFQPIFRSPTVVPRSTDWLDGLRGWASLIVFFYHFSYAYQPWVYYGYGSGDNRLFVTLPFIRLITAGPAMVFLFFAVSGYSLAWGPSRELQNGSPSKCLNRLASSIFRRPLRIFGPPIVASVMVLVCVRLGFYTFSATHNTGWGHFGFQEVSPPILDNPTQQLVHWYYSTANFVDCFTFGLPETHPYDGHLWTIPFEFRCSMMLFLVLAGLSRVRLYPRYAIFGALLSYAVWVCSWPVGLFIAGAALAQVSLVRQQIDHEHETLLPFLDEKLQPALREKSHVPEILFIIGLFLASAPERLQESTPGYRILNQYFTPYWWGSERWRFLPCIGALLLIYSVSTSSRLQSFFHNSVSRHLGRISFALYLCHGPICHMIGYTLVPTLWKYTNGPVQAAVEEGEDDPRRLYEGGTAMGYQVGFLLGGLVVVPTAIWVADLFARYIDEPLVRLGKFMETKMAMPYHS